MTSYEHLKLKVTQKKQKQNPDRHSPPDMMKQNIYTVPPVNCS